LYGRLRGELSTPREARGADGAAGDGHALAASLSARNLKPAGTDGTTAAGALLQRLMPFAYPVVVGLLESLVQVCCEPAAQPRPRRSHARGAATGPRRSL